MPTIQLLVDEPTDRRTSVTTIYAGVPAFTLRLRRNEEFVENVRRSGDVSPQQQLPY